jgi:hypothetical protein
MSFKYLTEFGLCIMLFDCLDVREGFSFEYVLCLECSSYFRCGLGV